MRPLYYGDTKKEAKAASFSSPASDDYPREIRSQSRSKSQCSSVAVSRSQTLSQMGPIGETMTSEPPHSTPRSDRQGPSSGPPALSSSPRHFSHARQESRSANARPTSDTTGPEDPGGALSELSVAERSPGGRRHTTSVDIWGPSASSDASDSAVKNNTSASCTTTRSRSGGTGTSVNAISASKNVDSVSSLSIAGRQHPHQSHGNIKGRSFFSPGKVVQKQDGKKISFVCKGGDVVDGVRRHSAGTVDVPATTVPLVSNGHHRVTYDSGSSSSSSSGSSSTLKTINGDEHLEDSPSVFDDFQSAAKSPDLKRRNTAASSSRLFDEFDTVASVSPDGGQFNGCIDDLVLNSKCEATVRHGAGVLSLEDRGTKDDGSTTASTGSSSSSGRGSLGNRLARLVGLGQIKARREGRHKTLPVKLTESAAGPSLSEVREEFGILKKSRGIASGSEAPDADKRKKLVRFGEREPTPAMVWPDIGPVQGWRSRSFDEPLVTVREFDGEKPPSSVLSGTLLLSDDSSAGLDVPKARRGHRRSFAADGSNPLANLVGNIPLEDTVRKYKCSPAEADAYASIYMYASELPEEVVRRLASHSSRCSGSGSDLSAEDLIQLHTKRDKAEAVTVEVSSFVPKTATDEDHKGYVNWLKAMGYEGELGKLSAKAVPLSAGVDGS